jgi:hypothetical protein
MKATGSPEGYRVLILAGRHVGEEGICLGKVNGRERWAVSPDISNEILELQFESEFALLLNLATDATRN